MATLAELVVKISGDTASLSAALGRAEKQMGGLHGTVNKLGGAFADVGKIAGGFVLAQGIMKAPGFFMDAAQAAADDAASVAKLQQAVENSGVAWSTYAGQLGTVIEAAQKRGFTDDESRDALALLTAQTNDAGEAAKRFALAQDLARGANIDVYTASKLLGKVTEENVNVLARYGIKVAEGTSETELFGLLQAKFGGQAETFAKSTAGQMAAAKIQMSELKESIGYAVLPVMTKLVDVVSTRLIPAMQKLADEWGPKVQAFFVDIQPELKMVWAYVEENVIPAIEDLARSFSETFAAIAVDVAYIVALIKEHWGQIQPFVQPIMDFIGTYVVGMFGLVRDILDIIAALLRGDFSAAWSGVQTLLGDIINFALLPVKLVLGEVQAAAQLIVDLLGQGWAAAWAQVSQTLTDIKNAVLWPYITVFGFLRDIIQEVVDKVGDLIETLGRIPKIDISFPGSDLFKKGLGFLGKGASGGVFGGLTLVGERGPELINLPGGSRVYSNSESRQIVSQSNSRSQNFYGPVTVQVPSGASSLAEELERMLR